MEIDYEELFLDLGLYTETELRKSISYAERPHRRQELTVGKITRFGCLRYFQEPFVLILKEHDFHPIRVSRADKLREWKALNIAAMRINGSHYHTLYVRVVPLALQRIGRDEIKYHLRRVLRKIEEAGMRKYLMAVVADGHRDALAAAAEKYPVLWEIRHLTTRMADHYYHWDTEVLQDLYSRRYVQDDWENRFPSMGLLNPPANVRRIYRHELENIRAVVWRKFQLNGRPFRLMRFNSRQSESIGSSLKIEVALLLRNIHSMHPHLFSLENGERMACFFTEVVAIFINLLES